MNKEKIGANTYLYPMPAVLVGAQVAGRANFITIAYCGIVQHKPPLIAFASGKVHYTNQGIKENQTFSVNIPSVEMIEVTDFVGLKSGSGFDKSTLFDIFYGDLQTAPMIKEAPLNMECTLVKTLDLGGMNDIFIGEIIQTYVDNSCLSNGLPDIKKMKPIIFSMHDNTYWELGAYIGKAWQIGRDYAKQPRNE